MRGALAALGLGLALLPASLEAGAGHYHHPDFSTVVPDLRPEEAAVARLKVSIPPDSWLHARAEVTAEPLSWEVGEAPPGILVGAVVMPKGRTYPDDSPFGPGPVHHGDIELQLPLTASKDAARGEVSIPTTVSWQLCNLGGCWGRSSMAIPLLTRVLPPVKAPSK